MYKSKLQELSYKRSWNLPVYSTVKEGPDHNPSFKGTVTVNGASFETPDLSGSSKDAQNAAAKIALDHFATDSPITMPTPPPPHEPTKQQQQHALASSSAVHHAYKNQLQIYTQKRNIDLPSYSCEREGPPHSCRFRSKVSVDGKTFESVDFFPTVREAEQAAAKVAYESLSSFEVQEASLAESIVYKNLLQELCQKSGLSLPKYDTTTSGPPHMATFVSTVDVGGQLFNGQEAKNKKQAEMNAAMVAYFDLKERANQEKSSSSSGVPPAPNAAAESCPPIIPINPLSIKEVIKDGDGHECSSSDDIVYQGLRDFFATNSAPASGTSNNCQKVLVYPRNLNMAVPDGASLLPYSDDKWMAAKMEPNPTP